jgi:YgiT-type zinc finger domain-containing protein
MQREENLRMKRDKAPYDYGECHICGEQMEEKQVTQEFWIKGKLILVEDSSCRRLPAVRRESSQG